MITFFSQQFRSQPSEDINPFRFTLSEFKFTPQHSSHTTFKIKQRPNTHAHREGLASQQITRANSYKAEIGTFKDKLVNGSVALPEENGSENRQKIVRTSKEKSHSSKKIYVPTDQIIEVVKNNHFSQFPQRTKSSKKMSPVKLDLDIRRKKEKRSGKACHMSPIELLTRKLQWQGKEKKRTIFFVREPKIQKQFKTTANNRDRPSKKAAVPPLSAWEGHQEDEFPFGGNHLY